MGSFPAKTTRIMVMLSPPRPPVRCRSGERHSSSNSSTTSEGRRRPSRSSSNRRRTKSTTCWLLRTSQMPSQATTMNSSVASRRKVFTSGTLETICSSGGRLEFVLYLRSPMDRERLRSPFTRKTVRLAKWWPRTQPPAFRIRVRSASRSGLWSSDSSTALPSRQSTARLSPALATTSLSWQTQQTTAVQPIQYGSTSRMVNRPCDRARSIGRFLGSASISSIRTKAARSAPGMSSLPPRAISPGKWSSQKRATCSPPCPSMTAKSAVSPQPSPRSGGSRLGLTTCASSIASRQPCMQL
mmetsp:Transcript_51611/g.142897  ORF Transcript_51611/g.142897 Transcript_51611/m.142897 type:complete len:299 (+) Transcript_51611:247-1143(+)